jgi:hypothetical protein
MRQAEDIPSKIGIASIAPKFDSRHSAPLGYQPEQRGHSSLISQFDDYAPTKITLEEAAPIHLLHPKAHQNRGRFPAALVETASHKDARTRNCGPTEAIFVSLSAPRPCRRSWRLQLTTSAKAAHR